MSSTPIPWLSDENEGFVTSTTRRWIYFCDQAGSLRQGTIATKALDITVGDRIHFERGAGEYLIDSYQPRENSLQRRKGKQSKLLSANIDVLFVVTAVGKLFQPNFVDRVLCVAYLENIKVVLVVNKIDLEIDRETESYIQLYESLGITVIQTSAKLEDGISPIYDIMKRPDLKVISLVGVSGVGKSSILNRLIPDADRSTSQVSDKSGTGRQTTSQAEAFRYINQSDNVDLFIIDLPGVQNFGIGHLEQRNISRGMPDIQQLATGCEYSDCQHIAEEHCSVKEALESGEFPVTRFESYLSMIDEIEHLKEY